MRSVQNSKVIVFIDELERSLDPKNQKIIADLISKVSGDLHFVISTHSPYVFSSEDIQEVSSLQKVALTEIGTTIDEFKNINQRVLNTVTWAEINYLAYDIDSAEYLTQLIAEMRARR